MKKKLVELIAASEMMGGLPEIKIRNSGYDGSRKYHKAPRSMTEEEKEYYDKHRNLNGFKTTHNE